MKSKSEMGSKAGINLTERNPGFRNIFSKSASLLLVAVLGLSAMSFIQDDALVNDKDTNQHAAKMKEAVVVHKPAEVSEQATDPGDDAKASFFISTPGKKARHQSDRETIVGFISEVKQRKIWSMERKDIATEADKEMQLNFKLASIYPSAKMMAEADREITGKFVDDIVHVAAFTANAAVRSDAEMCKNFVAANLVVTVTKPSADSLLKADAGIIAAFAGINRPVIGMPPAVVAQKADEQMMQNYELQTKLTVLK